MNNKPKKKAYKKVAKKKTNEVVAKYSQVEPVEALAEIQDDGKSLIFAATVVVLGILAAIVYAVVK